MKEEDAWHWDVPDLISREEESELASKAVEGDFEARVKLVMSNLRLVLFLASALARYPHEKQDLVGEGLLGAWIAVNRYSPIHGVRFCTYATWWVKSYMIHHKKKSMRLLWRAPDTYLLHKELARSYAMDGRDDSDDEVRQIMAERFEISQKRLQIMLQPVKKVCLDAPIDGGHTLADALASDTRGPEDECARGEERTLADVALSVLTDREALVVRSALMGDETFSDVGAKLGVSKQRAKQICDKAVVKMRRRVKGCSNFHDHYA